MSGWRKRQILEKQKQENKPVQPYTGFPVSRSTSENPQEKLSNT